MTETFRDHIDLFSEIETSKCAELSVKFENYLKYSFWDISRWARAVFEKKNEVLFKKPDEDEFQFVLTIKNLMR
jgi:16S rRNA C1402 (ribose-2'-O) methylase RsmI